MDDIEVGRRFRAVRIHRGWRQLDLATAAGISRAGVSRIERGRFEEVDARAPSSRRAALDMRVELVARWRGGDLDRMVNARHAALHEAAALLVRTASGLDRRHPRCRSTSTASAARSTSLPGTPTDRALLVVELKTEIVRRPGPARARSIAIGAWRRRSRANAAGDPSERLDLGRSRGRPIERARRWQPIGPCLRGAFPADGRRLAAWLRRTSGVVCDALTFLPYASPGEHWRTWDAATRPPADQGRLTARFVLEAADALPGARRAGRDFAPNVHVAGIRQTPGRAGVRRGQAPSSTKNAGLAARGVAAEGLLGHDQAVDLVRALVDLGTLRVPHQALDPGLA